MEIIDPLEIEEQNQPAIIDPLEMMAAPSPIEPKQPLPERILSTVIEPPIHLEKAKTFWDWTKNLAKGTVNLAAIPFQLPAQTAYSVVGRPLQEAIEKGDAETFAKEASKGVVDVVKGFGEFFLAPFGYAGYKKWAESGFEGKLSSQVVDAAKDQWLTDPAASLFAIAAIVAQTRSLSKTMSKTSRLKAEMLKEAITKENLDSVGGIDKVTQFTKDILNELSPDEAKQMDLNFERMVTPVQQELPGMKGLMKEQPELPLWKEKAVTPTIEPELPGMPLKPEAAAKIAQGRTYAKFMEEEIAHGEVVAAKKAEWAGKEKVGVENAKQMAMEMAAAEAVDTGELPFMEKFEFRKPAKNVPKDIAGKAVLYEIDQPTGTLYALDDGTIVKVNGEKVGNVPKIGQLSLISVTGEAKPFVEAGKIAKVQTDVEKGLLEKKSPEVKIAQTVKDKVEGPLTAAEGHLERGNHELAIEAAKKVLAKGDQLIAADGEITKTMVDAAKVRAQEVIAKAEEAKGMGVQPLSGKPTVVESVEFLRKQGYTKEQINALGTPEARIAEAERLQTEAAAPKAEAAEILEPKDTLIKRLIDERLPNAEPEARAKFFEKMTPAMKEKWWKEIINNPELEDRLVRGQKEVDAIPTAEGEIPIDDLLAAEEKIGEGTTGRKRLVSEDDYNASMDWLDKYPKDKLFGGLPEMEYLKHLGKTIIYHVENAIMKLEDFTKMMVSKMGEPIRSHIEPLWKRVADRTVDARIKGKDARDVTNLLTESAAKFYGRGARSGVWAEEMIKKFGDDVKPFLTEAWNAGAEASKVASMVTKRLQEFGDPTKMVAKTLSEAEVKMFDGINKDIEIDDWFLGRFTNPQRLFDEINSKNPGIDVKDVLLHDYNAREKAKAIEAEAIKAFIYGDREKSWWKLFPAMEKTLRKSTFRIGVFAAYEQKGGPELMEYMGFKKPVLTDFEKAAYQRVRQVLEELLPKINAAREIAGKDPIGYIDNYWTFWRATMQMAKKGQSLLDTPAADILQTMKEVRYDIHPRTTKFAYLKRREGLKQAIDLDFFGVFDRYMIDALRHIYMSPYIAKIRDITKEGGIKIGVDVEGKPIEFNLNKKAPVLSGQLARYADFVAGTKNAREWGHVEGKFGAAIQFFTRNVAYQTLAFSTRAVLIQPAALVGTATIIGPKYTAIGAKKWFNESERKMAEDLSQLLIPRKNSFETAANDAMSALRRSPSGIVSKLGGMQQQLGQLGLNALGAQDHVAATMTWLGAYHKVMEVDGLMKIDAVKFADETVLRTQGSALRGHLAPIQRTIGGRAATLFQTFVINQWGLLWRDIIKSQEYHGVKGSETARRMITFMAATSLVNTIYEDVLGISSPMPAPIRGAIESLSDPNNDMSDVVMDTLMEFAEPVPGIGTVKYGGTPGGAVLQLAGDLSAKLGGKKGPTRSSIDLATKMLGVPGGGQAAKMWRQLEAGGSPYDIIMGTYPDHRRLMLEILMEVGGGESTPQKGMEYEDVFK